MCLLWLSVVKVLVYMEDVPHVQFIAEDVPHFTFPKDECQRANKTI